MAMKYVLLIVIVLAVLWLIRSRAPKRPPETRKPPSAPDVQPMVTCAHCGVHLPSAEAVAGLQGEPFCSEAHRLAHHRAD